MPFGAKVNAEGPFEPGLDRCGRDRARCGPGTTCGAAPAPAGASAGSSPRNTAAAAAETMRAFIVFPLCCVGRWPPGGDPSVHFRHPGPANRRSPFPARRGPLRRQRRDPRRAARGVRSLHLPARDSSCHRRPGRSSGDAGGGGGVRGGRPRPPEPARGGIGRGARRGSRSAVRAAGPCAASGSAMWASRWPWSSADTLGQAQDAAEMIWADAATAAGGARSRGRGRRRSDLSCSRNAAPTSRPGSSIGGTTTCSPGPRSSFAVGS